MTGALPAVIGVMLATVTIGGAVAAVAVREQRMAILGVLVACAVGPFLMEPLPDPRGLLAGIVGASIAAYVLLIAVRGGPEVDSQANSGWPAMALAATTAAAAVFMAGAGAPPGAEGQSEGLVEAGPLAVAGGTALLVLAASPILLARSALRLTLGLLLAVTGTSLVVGGTVGPATPLTGLAVAGLLAVLAASGGLLHRIAYRSRIQPARR
jgi:hypothetical protein